MTVRAKGLANFLAKIEADPSNIVLRERLMALLADLPDSTDKIEVVLELARILVPHQPEQAMELAYDAFSFDDSNFEALKVVAACLRALGRPGKAEVIENEIARFREGASNSNASAPLQLPNLQSDSNVGSMPKPLEPSEDSKATFAPLAVELPQFGSLNSRETKAPPPNVAANAGTGTGTGTGSGTQSKVDIPDAAFMAGLQAGTVVQAFQAGDLFRSNTSSQMQPAAATPPPAVDVTAPPSVAAAPAPQPAPAPVTFSLQMEDDKKEADPLDNLFTPISESASEERVENLFAAVEKQFPTPAPAAVAPTAAAPTPTPASVPMSDLTPSSVGEFRAQSRADETRIYGHAPVAPRVEAPAPAPVQPVAKKFEPVAPQPIAIEASLAEDDDNKYATEFATLLEAGQARKTLLLMRLALNDEPSPELAATIWQYLPQVWQMLGLRGFHWDSAQGVDALIELMKQRQAPRMSAVTPTPPSQRGPRQSKTHLVS